MAAADSTIYYGGGRGGGKIISRHNRCEIPPVLGPIHFNSPCGEEEGSVLERVWPTPILHHTTYLACCTLFCIKVLL